MSKSPMWRRYLRFFGPDGPADVGDEIGFHLESRSRELMEQGLSPDEARLQASRQFGNVNEFTTQCERIDEEQLRRSNWQQRLEEWRHDIRMAVRGLWGAPKFSLVVIGTLAAGIGGTAMLFSIVDSWAIHAVRFPDPSRLVYVSSFDKPRGRDIRTSWADYQDLRSRAAGLQSLAAWRPDTFTFGSGSSSSNFAGNIAPERVPGARVTTDFFHVLQTRPRAGRLFTAADGVNGNHHVAIVSETFWRTRLQSRTLDSGVEADIEGEPWTVIGVLPEDFHFTLADVPDVWVPLAVRPEDSLRRELRMVEMIGRLNPRVSVEQGRGQLNSVAADIAREFPATNAGIAVYFETLAHEVGKHTFEQIIMMVLAITIGLFLIACSNVGSLLLVRSQSRRRQAAIRLSLGAPAGRLVRQALTETLLLFAAGGTLGALIADRLNPALAASIPVISRDYLPSHGQIIMNWPVFGAIMPLALLSALLFGVGPALETLRADVASELKDAAAAMSQTTKTRRLRIILVVAQVFLAITLGSATIALVQGSRTMWSHPTGFDTRGLLTFRISPERSRYDDEVRRPMFFESASAAVTTAWPGAQVTIAESIPFPWEYGSTRFQIDDRAAVNPLQLPRAAYNAVDASFFATLRIPVLAGRIFESRDSGDQNLKAIVNDVLVKQHLAGSSPIGHKIRLSALDKVAEIIGVVSEIQVGEDSLRGSAQVYVPFAQAIPRSAGFIVRAPAGQDPLSTIPAIRRALAAIDARQPIHEVRSMDDRLYERFAPFKIIASMLVIFGGLALLLAALGVYGMVAFSVSQRTREIGIRAALGADRGKLLRLFVRQGLGLFLFAPAPGMLASFVITRLINSALPDMVAIPTGLPMAGSVTILGLSVLVATLVPAWRAATSDPLTAIRHE